LATYVGWLLHKIVPSIFILWALSYIYVAFGTIPWIAAIFYGLKPAVLAIVAAAVIRIGRLVRHRRWHRLFYRDGAMEVGYCPRSAWCGFCGSDLQDVL
jgi:chromate transport protein ChrA